MLKKSSNKSSDSKPVDSVDTLIGVGTQIQGDIEFAGGLRIDGSVVGNIKSVDGNNSTIVLSETAVIEGNIAVSHVIVDGTVNGNIIASERVILQSKAVIKGDVRYRTIETSVGAAINGALVCDSSNVKQSAPPVAKPVASTKS